MVLRKTSWVLILIILSLAAFPLAGQDAPRDPYNSQNPQNSQTPTDSKPAAESGAAESGDSLSDSITSIIEKLDPQAARDIEADIAAETAEVLREISGSEAAEGEGVPETTENPTEEAQRHSLFRRLVAAGVIVLFQLALIFLAWQLFKLANKRALSFAETKLKPLTIRKFQLLTISQLLRMIAFGLRVIKYLVTLFQLYITLPLVFSLFPLTRHLAVTLIGYILNPLKKIALGAVGYIPNLITIVIIMWITRYALRGLKFFATQIEKGKLVIPGFYAEWAQPTFNILRTLLYAFTIAVIYPYLPGSGSPIFQGVSVFVGIIFSLGSTSAIGNLIAGLVITYMRPFKIGDRIQIQGITGFVVEKSPIIIRIKTHKNEYVTFPNQQILSTSIINYQTSAEGEGYIVNAAITMGYSIPWPQVHELLLKAAAKTPGMLEMPKPFVLQTALDDFYAKYEINAYVKDVDRLPAIYSELYQNIQDAFKGANIDMTAPHFFINMPADAGPSSKVGAP